MRSNICVQSDLGGRLHASIQYRANILSNSKAQTEKQKLGNLHGLSIRYLVVHIRHLCHTRLFTEPIVSCPVYPKIFAKDQLFSPDANNRDNTSAM